MISELRRYRYVTFDDLIKGDCNIDHVVVGPGGVFAIETRAYGRFGNGRVGVGPDGVFRIGTRPALSDPTWQAKSAARIVADELRGRLRRDVEVRPIIVSGLEC